MPEAGLDWMDSAALLSTEELQRLLRIATTHLGIREIRFTGGEPLLRRDLSEIIAYAAQLRPRPTLSLTTNGVGPGPQSAIAGPGRAGPHQRLPRHR